MDYATRQGKKRRRGYQYHEDMAIFDYIAENNLYMFVHGNECWNAMAIKKITPHSAHSMRTHFLKVMIKKLDVYDISDEVKAKIRAYTNMAYSNKFSSDESDSSSSIMHNKSIISQRHRNTSSQPRNLNSSMTSNSSIHINSKSPILKINTTNISTNSSKNHNAKISKNIKNKLFKNKLIYLDESLCDYNTQTKQQNEMCINYDLDKQTNQTTPTLHHKSNQLILNELKNLHKNITQIPFLSSTPNRVLNRLDNFPKILQNNILPDHNDSNLNLDYQFVHNAYTLLEPLNEVPYFLISEPDLSPNSPTPSSQFYTPTLQFQNGALVNPELVNNVDASDVENSSCNTLCGVDIFPALHSSTLNNSSTNCTARKTDGVNRDINAQSTLNCTPSQRLPHTNYPKADKLSNLREQCERLNITPNDMYLFLRQQRWLKEILKCALSANDFD